MSFMDKVKTNADTLARKSMDAGAKGQAKMEAMQAKRRGDALLHDLGAAVYNERHLGGPADTSRALLAQLDQHAAEHGLDTSPDVVGGNAAPDGPATPPAR